MDGSTTLVLDSDHEEEALDTVNPFDPMASEKCKFIEKDDNETCKLEIETIDWDNNGTKAIDPKIKETSDHGDGISCKECGKLYIGSRKVFSIMYHLIQCSGTNEKERKAIIDEIVNENLRLGSWELDESPEDILQHRITRFEMEPLSNCSIRQFINIHINADTKVNDKIETNVASPVLILDSDREEDINPFDPMTPDEDSVDDVASLVPIGSLEDNATNVASPVLNHFDPMDSDGNNLSNSAEDKIENVKFYLWMTLI